MTNNKLFDGIIIFVQVVKSGAFSSAAEVLGIQIHTLVKKLIN
ncbi:hypothetical protein [Photobacterium kishitanii]|nr:hypothetical protein [Photobacterium kishitanii]